MEPPTSDLGALLRDLAPDQIADLVADLSPPEAEALIDELGRLDTTVSGSPTPLGIAPSLYDSFADRSHLSYLSDRIAAAVKDVEGGRSRSLIIQLPPRSGKTTLNTLITPSWLLARHPSWPYALVSHDGTLASSWGRQIRRWAEGGALGSSVAVSPDAGAVGSWETTEGGRMLSLSTRESFIGRGAKVLIIDDPHKDFVDAHSATMRQNVWDWWLSVAQTRLEPPYLVLIVMTRWHEDDLVGRLLSTDYEGDPADWEVLSLPAIATDHDPLGREPGDPLISPLITETRDEAVLRWSNLRKSVGEYVWSAMFQQRPAPARGAVFDAGWWRYWTTDPGLATQDGRVELINPADDLASARWLDSWDLTFKGGTTTGDFVVGQRWARRGPDRYLIDQQRGRWSFTQTMERMENWSRSTSPYGHLVHQVLIEEAANGAAVIDVLKDKISGVKAIRPRGSKEVRARAVTPEMESGNVRLPHPRQAPWVNDFLAEVREFPHGAHDDQVDAMSQALSALRDPGRGRATVPGAQVHRDLGRAARSDLAKHRSRSGYRRP